MTAAINTLGRLGLGASATEDPVTRRLEYVDFDLGIEDELRDINGTVGRYDPDDARVRQNLTKVIPRLRCQPTATELTYLLPWILDGTPVSTTYPLGNTTSLLSLHFDPNAGNLWKLPNVAVDTATFSASQGEPLDVDMELVGRTYTRSGSFPAVSLDIATQPFLFTDAALVVNATTIQARRFSLSVRKNIDRNRFFNSATLTAQNKLRREIAWSFEIPWGDYNALYGAATSAGVAVTATFTNGLKVLTFSSSAVRFVPRSPATPFQQEVMLTIEGLAYTADGDTTAPLVTTLALS